MQDSTERCRNCKK